MALKNIRFNINLYIIIPLIFAGLSALALLVAYEVTRYYMIRSLSPEWPLAFWGTILTLFTFILGLFTVRYIIEPVRRFVDKTQTMGMLSGGVAVEPFPRGTDTELHQFSRVFDQVSELLSKVEARELFPNIIGHSEAIRRVFNQIMKVSSTSSTVLIVGETGTGKELVANSIHKHSLRQEKPFVAINCAAIPEGLLESELFGHEKGAFTGAEAKKPGKFELAHEGTLFLNEIENMPLETQAKVLRALEERKIERVGAVTSKSVDVRFIAATNKELPALVEQGRFRQDLYYRLNVFAIYLPPLRDRREDIPIIAENFLENDGRNQRLSSAAIQMLISYDWPGNVRELKNAVRSSSLMAKDIIEPVHLPSSITQNWPHHDRTDALAALAVDSEYQQNMDHKLQELEKQMILKALRQSRGIQKQAASLLGIKERSLWHRLKKYEIDASAFKIK